MPNDIDPAALRALLDEAPAEPLTVAFVRPEWTHVNPQARDFYDAARAHMGALLDALAAAEAQVEELREEREANRLATEAYARERALADEWKALADLRGRQLNRLNYAAHDFWSAYTQYRAEFAKGTSDDPR